MWFKSSPIKLKQLHQILKWTVWKLNHYKSQPSQISDLNKQIERFININDEINEKLHNNEKLTKCAWNRNGDETNLLKILWCNTGEVETEATVDEEENEERRECDGSRKRHSVWDRNRKIDRSVKKWILYVCCLWILWVI